MTALDKSREKLIEKFKTHEADTGSTEVQIGLLTKSILELTEHLKKNRKDHSARRGLLKMVAKRRKLLEHLRFTNEKRYNTLAKKIENSF
jgi:small subunit ribosomal protein S15